MVKPEFDESKMPMAEELISAAAEMMAERDCEDDEDAKAELAALEEKLRVLTGKKNLDIRDFKRYWSYTDLETVAKNALISDPVKTGMSDEQISEIVTAVYRVQCSESEMDYYLQVLKVETGLENISDYIFYPDLVGLSGNAGLDDMIAKILADRK